MSKRGGYRPGAGRPRGARNIIPTTASEARDQLNKMAMEHWEPIVAGLIEESKGLWYEKIDDKDGEVHVYKSRPNIKATQILAEFLIGKPKIEIDNKLSGTVESPAIQSAMSDLTKTMQALLSKKP